jgi:hypothetical protein
MIKISVYDSPFESNNRFALMRLELCMSFCKTLCSAHGIPGGFSGDARGMPGGF